MRDRREDECELVSAILHTSHRSCKSSERERKKENESEREKQRGSERERESGIIRAAHAAS